MQMPDASVSEPSTQKHRRVDVRLPVRISTIDSEKDPHSGRAYFRSSDEVCRNVSRGGVFVITEEPMRPGSRILLELELPGGASVQTIGRVAWSRARLAVREVETQSGIGVEFLGGTPEHLSALERYLSSALRRSRPAAADSATAASGTSSTSTGAHPADYSASNFS